eukprot:6485988-Amphidinium_carterae.2
MHAVCGSIPFTALRCLLVRKLGVSQPVFRNARWTELPCGVVAVGSESCTLLHEHCSGCFGYEHAAAAPLLTLKRQPRLWSASRNGERQMCFIEKVLFKPLVAEIHAFRVQNVNAPGFLLRNSFRIRLHGTDVLNYVMVREHKSPRVVQFRFSTFEYIASGGSLVLRCIRNAGR